MRRRKDETDEAFAIRRAEYDRARRATAEGAAKNRACAKAWREKNKGQKQATDAAWRLQNGGVLREARADWKRRNTDKLRAYKQKRRKSAVGALSGDIVRRLMLLQRGKCAHCWACIATASHLDHIEPLARGGLNVDSNVQLLCPACNTRKGARDPFEFAATEGRLL